MAEKPLWCAATSTVHLLHRASHGIDELFLRTVGGELTPRQFVVLDAVAEAEGLNQVAITQATGIDRSSTTDLVLRLMRRGLLRRRRDTRDVRSYAVRLTPKGRELINALRPSAERMDRAIIQGERGGSPLIGLLERIEGMLSSAHSNGAPQRTVRRRYVATATKVD